MPMMHMEGQKAQLNQSQNPKDKGLKSIDLNTPLTHELLKQNERLRSRLTQNINESTQNKPVVAKATLPEYRSPTA